MALHLPLCFSMLISLQSIRHAQYAGTTSRPQLGGCRIRYDSALFQEIGAAPKMSFFGRGGPSFIQRGSSCPHLHALTL